MFMKKRFMIIVSMLVMMVLSACNMDSVKEYIYDKEIFIERYNEALKSVNNGKMPKETALTDSKETGFAVVPLNEDIYGIDSFAVLPIISRELSDEEMLQLAFGMGGIDAKEILSEKYSWTELERDESQKFSWKERQRNNNLLSKYLYGDLRSTETFSNDPSQGGPIYVNIKNDNSGGYFKYWIYPKAPLTDNQYLYIIEMNMEDAKEGSFESLLPSSEEIQYDELKALADGYLKEYGLSEKPSEDFYGYYSVGSVINSNNPINRDNAFWTVNMILSDGDDFTIEISAKDGSFLEWERFPEGYYSDTDPGYPVDIKEGNNSEEDVKEVIINYTNSFLLKDDISIQDVEILVGEKNVFYGPLNNVIVTLSNNEKYEISISKVDLKIHKVKFNKN